MTGLLHARCPTCRIIRPLTALAAMPLPEHGRPPDMPGPLICPSPNMAGTRHSRYPASTPPSQTAPTPLDAPLPAVAAPAHEPPAVHAAPAHTPGTRYTSGAREANGPMVRSHGRTYTEAADACA